MKVTFKNILKNLQKNWITYGFETLVVVIGILGAFELENWKERRQDRIKEHQYLNRIKNDIKSDTVYFNRRIVEAEEEMDNIYTFIHKMYETQKTLEDYQSLISLSKFPTEHLTIQNFTFVEMTNSGNLDLLSNNVLKEELISYYNISEMHGKHIQEINEWTVARFLNFSEIVYSSKNSSWGKKRVFDDPEMFEYEDWSFINDPYSREFKIIEGVMDAYHAKLYTINPYFKDLKVHAALILKILNQEIN